MNKPDFIIDALDKAYKNYIFKLEDCKKNFREAAVHDLRVTIRRFLAMIAIIEVICPVNYLKDIKKVLKQQLKLFNPLRDTQVEILTVRNMIYSHPVLYVFYVFLFSKEQKLIQEIKSLIFAIEPDDLEGLTLFLKIYLKQKYNLSFKPFDELFNSGFRAFAIVMERRKLINEKDLNKIHKFRIAFKKFRYTMEFLQPIANITKEDLKNMKILQTILGNIQDNKVFVNELNEFIVRQETLSHKLYHEPMKELLIKRDILINELLDNLNIIDTLNPEEIFRDKVK